MTTVQKGNKIKVHYTGTLDDGTEFDNSRGRDPISFEVGSGEMIPGFDAACVGLEVGGTKEFYIDPEHGYGEPKAEAVQVIPRSQFPEHFEFTVGGSIQGKAPNGLPFIAKIVEQSDENVTLDFNHPLAGQRLNFTIEIVELEE